MGGHAKRETHVHSGRVALYRGVNELLDFRERYYLIELATDLGPAHAEYRAVEKDIFAACQLWMETGTHLQQRSDTAVDCCSSTRRFGYARKNSEERALAGAIATNYADQIAGIDLERKIIERPDVMAV